MIKRTLFIVVAIGAMFIPLARPALAVEVCTGALPCIWEDIQYCAETEQLNQTCGLCELMQLLVNVFHLLLALVGGLVLIMFVWGGFQWLTSAGGEEKIKKGRATMVGAVIGLAIVLGAWTLTNLIIFTLSGAAQEENAAGPPTFVGQIFGKPWYRADFCGEQQQ